MGSAPRSRRPFRMAPSTSSTRRCVGSRWPKCRSPMPRTSSARRCRRPRTPRPRSARPSPRSAGWPESAVLRGLIPMPEILMPRLSDTMESGVIVRWHKQAGDQVTPGETLAEIETDKAVMEYEAYEAGVLGRILVPEGEEAAIGDPIATLGNEQLVEPPAAPPT